LELKYKILNINKLYIHATNQTPEINFNPTAVIFEMSGVYILTQSETFFSPIIKLAYK